jgi:hypothetical protein
MRSWTENDISRLSIQLLWHFSGVDYPAGRKDDKSDKKMFNQGLAWIKLHNNGIWQPLSMTTGVFMPSGCLTEDKVLNYFDICMERLGSDKFVVEDRDGDLSPLVGHEFLFKKFSMKPPQVTPSQTGNGDILPSMAASTNPMAGQNDPVQILVQALWSIHMKKEKRRVVLDQQLIIPGKT